MANPLPNKQRFDRLEKAIVDIAKALADPSVANEETLARELVERFADPPEEKKPPEPTSFGKWYTENTEPMSDVAWGAVRAAWDASRRQAIKDVADEFRHRGQHITGNHIENHDWGTFNE